MNIVTILGNAQTYIGVLATFIVLCLFISKTEKESNFIIYTILKVGEDFKKHLKIHVDAINTEIKRSASGDLPWSELPAPVPRETEDRLNANSRNIMMITQKFFHNATKISDQFNPDPHFQEKEELPFIALLCLLLIITTMLVDCLTFIPLNLRCMFITLLLGTSTVFISVLYHKFFQDDHSQTPSATVHEKPNRKIIIFVIFILLLLWFFIAPFITSPVISVLLLTAIQLSGGYALKRKWILLCHKNNSYNRFMILKHYACFVIYILAVTALLTYGDSFLNWRGADKQSLENWHAAISLIESLPFCYYFILLFFSFNTLFGPLFMGFIYLNRKEREIIRQIRAHQQQIQPIIQQYIAERNNILTGIN